MSQTQNTIPNKVSGDQLTGVEFTELKDQANHNATDVENRIIKLVDYKVVERGLGVNDPNFLNIQNHKVGVTQSYSHSIIELMAPPSAPYESTLALYLPALGGPEEYFMDVSMLNFNSEPRGVIVMQSRGTADIPPLRVAFSDGTLTYNTTEFTKEGVLLLKSDNTTLNRRIELGDYGVAQDYIRGNATGLAGARATSYMFNARMDDKDTDRFVAHNQWVNPLRMEMNGDSEIKFGWLNHLNLSQPGTNNYFWQGQWVDSLVIKNTGINVTGKVTADNLNLAGMTYSFADDVAAGLGGLVTGDVYQADGTGADSLGSLRIKQ